MADDSGGTLARTNGHGGVSQITAKAEKLLMNNERILASAHQTDMARWWIWPGNGVVVTNHRIIFINNGFFQFSFHDFHWEHVEDVHVSVNFGGADLTLTATESKKGVATQVAQAKTRRFTVQGLVTDQAQEVYRVSQQMEHDWREINRQRVMEESRATKGGGVVMMQSAPVPPTSAAPQQDPIDRLRKLKELVDAGVLSKDEYETKKSEIMKLL
jgi:hypothetical protein